MQKRCGWVAVAFAGVALVQLARVAQTADVLVVPTGEPAAPVILAAADVQRTAGDGVLFAEGSANLGARAPLQPRAQWLWRNSAVLVTLLGHGNHHGDDDPGLPEHGAAAMRQRLLDDGVVLPRIKTLAFGCSQSFAHGADAVCATQNRAVVTPIALPQPDNASNHELALWREDAPRRQPRWLF